MTKLESQHAEQLSLYNDVMLAEAIDHWVIGMFNAERNRAILKRSMIDGIGFERIAEEFGMSRRQIANIVHKSQEKLFKHI